MVRNRTPWCHASHIAMLISVLASKAYAMRFLILPMLFVVGSLMADPVLSFDTTTALTAGNFDQTVGWEFNVLSPITVTGLGWYNQGANGLELSHMVGIWSSTGTLLASATVAAGTTDPLDGLFRTVAITPIVLQPGEFIIAGENFLAGSDDLAFDVTPTTDASISFVAGRYSAADNMFEFPTNSTGVVQNSSPDCCWGPSFSISAATVSTPEPAGSSLLLAVGALAAALQTRRRHRL